MITRAIWTTTYLFLLILFCFQNLTAAEDQETPVEQATVWIEVRNQTNASLGTGSGVFVSPQGYILTAYHVIKDYYTGTDNKIIVKRVGTNLTLKEENSVTIISKDPAVDLALLRVSGENFPFLKIGNSSNLQTGVELSVYGFENGSGVISVIPGTLSNKDWKVALFLPHGFSGGPVVLKGCNVLVGIVSRGLEESPAPSLTKIVPSQHSYSFVRQAASAQTDALCSKIEASTVKDPSPFWEVEPEKVSLDEDHNFVGKFKIRNISDEEVDWRLSNFADTIYSRNPKDDSGMILPRQKKEIEIIFWPQALIKLMHTPSETYEKMYSSIRFLVKSQKFPMEKEVVIFNSPSILIKLNSPN